MKPDTSRKAESIKYRFDAVVLGMGPAGMAAAIELADLGVNVAVVDENPEPGGQVYRQPPAVFTVTEPSFLGVNYKKGQNLIKSFRLARSKIRTFNDTYVWGFFNGDTLSLVQNGKVFLMTCDKLLLAEGVIERSIPFPGWTLPGIMTLGGLQKLVVHERLLPGRRFLLAGCSPLLLPVAASLTRAGGEIVAICDALRHKAYIRLIPQLLRQKGLVNEAVSYFLPVIRKSVPIVRPFAVAAASGDTKVRQVTLVKLDENWEKIPGSEKQFDVDILGVSYGFLPSARLARLCGCTHTYDSAQNSWKPNTDNFMRTSLSHIYVAGDSAGVGGADMAEVEGRIAAIHMACELGRLSVTEMERRVQRLYNDRERIESYASIFNQLFFPRPGLYRIMEKETVVCRCEHVTVEQILEGVELGYRNINEMKRTRAGMGLCQARTCESIISKIMIQKGIPIQEIGYLNLRPPLSPIPLSLFEAYANSEDLKSTLEPPVTTQRGATHFEKSGLKVI